MARLRGNRWQADALIDGVRVRKGFATREAAEEFERLASLGVDTVVTLKDFADANFKSIWGDNDCPENVHKNLRALYREFGEDFPIRAVTTIRFDQAIANWQTDGLSASSINHRVSTMSKLLKYAKRHQVILEMPDLARQKGSNLLERIWSKDDERKAFEYLDHVGLKTTRMVLQFLLYTGARRGEAYNLTRKSVKEGWINFDRKITKNGTTRQIPMVPKAKEAWDYLCKATDLDCPLQAVNYWTVSQHWKLLRGHFDAVSDRAFVPHMLRHTCATRLVSAGIVLPQVMKWMGHKSIQVTMRYVYVAPRDLDLAAQALAA